MKFIKFRESCGILLEIAGNRKSCGKRQKLRYRNYIVLLIIRVLKLSVYVLIMSTRHIPIVESLNLFEFCTRSPLIILKWSHAILWSSILNVTNVSARPCPVPTISNGRVDGGSSVQPGKELVYSCYSGYSPDSVAAVYCVTDDQFSSKDVPKCIGEYVYI